MTVAAICPPGKLYAAALVAGALLALAPQAADSQARRSQPTQAGPGRLAPPAALDCTRDNTTSFNGRVLSYRRGGGRVRIRVRTDEGTTEQFTLRYGKGGAREIFLLDGGPFREADFRKIETRAGALRPGTRAIVWACYRNNDPSPLLIDWRPAEGASEPPMKR